MYTFIQGWTSLGFFFLTQLGEVNMHQYEKLKVNLIFSQFKFLVELKVGNTNLMY